jgi:glycerol uptake facilitator-like aquaporin
VTFSLAVFRGFPWRKVPLYISAQLLGGFCGAGIVYANYFHAIDIVEGGPNIRTINGSGDLFATYAVRFIFTNPTPSLRNFAGKLPDPRLMLLFGGTICLGLSFGSSKNADSFPI